ncbi:hypothetical protein SAMN05444679_102331 [Variovorax sp. CF079]|nr:hypothetical protein SAMN05444679_102331 [Variovorax sp. CF079]
MTPGEPQSAADYDDRTTAAVKTVLIEIGQILGSAPMHTSGGNFHKLRKGT